MQQKEHSFDFYEIKGVFFFFAPTRSARRTKRALRRLIA
jgi:hypothetical protein